MIKLIALPLLLTACTFHNGVTAPNVVSEALQAQILRIEPELHWSHGCPSATAPNNITGEPEAQIGDCASGLGFILLYGRMGTFDTFRQSVSPDGQPWRNPTYVNRDTSDQYSRDQLLGLLEATAASKDISLLQRVYMYTKAHNNKLCPNPTDTRCDITSTISILIRDALGMPVSAIERDADETLLHGESYMLPGNYRANLLARIIMLKATTGRLTTAHAKAIATLHNRFPNNLFWHTVHSVANKGADFDNIVTDLVMCMQQWVSPQENWLWTREELCYPSTGHELVALGKYLLNLKQQEL